MVSLIRSQDFLENAVEVASLFMLVSSLLLFMVVTVHRTRRLTVERLDAVDIFNVSPHEVSAGIYVVPVEVFRIPRSLEMLMHAALEAIGQQLRHFINVALPERLVSDRNCRTQVASGWFQTCGRRALTCAMDAHEGFEEILVSDLAGFGAQSPNRQSVVEGPLDLRFIWLLHPDENEIDVARFESLLRGLDNRAVKSVTMR